VRTTKYKGTIELKVMAGLVPAIHVFLAEMA